MDRIKRIEGILSAPPEKRYKNFISTVVDKEEIWVLSNEDGYATYEIDNKIHLLVWPEKIFAQKFAENETAESIEVHDFCDRCEEAKRSNLLFLVFYNGKSAFCVDAEKMLNDIQYGLSLVE